MHLWMSAVTKFHRPPQSTIQVCRPRRSLGANWRLPTKEQGNPIKKPENALGLKEKWVVIMIHKDANQPPPQPDHRRDVLCEPTSGASQRSSRAQTSHCLSDWAKHSFMPLQCCSLSERTHSGIWWNLMQGNVVRRLKVWIHDQDLQISRLPSKIKLALGE